MTQLIGDDAARTQLLALIGGIGATLAGGDGGAVYAAANIAAIGHQYNYLSHAEMLSKLRAEAALAACQADAGACSAEKIAELQGEIRRLTALDELRDAQLVFTCAYGSRVQCARLLQESYRALASYPASQHGYASPEEYIAALGVDPQGLIDEALQIDALRQQVSAIIGQRDIQELSAILTAFGIGAAGGAIAAGGYIVAVDAIPAALACMRSPACFNEMAIALGEAAAGDGWMDVYRSKKVAATTAEVDNVASSLTAGGNVDISARGTSTSSARPAPRWRRRDSPPGATSPSPRGWRPRVRTYSRKVSGVGIGVSPGNGSASLSIGAHRDSLYQAHEKTVAEASLIQGGSGVVITAGRDVTAIAADIVSGGDIAVTAGRDLALLAATEVERELEIREQSFVGLKAEVSQNVSGALEQLKGAASTFNSGYGNDAYKAIGMASGIMQGVDAALQLSNPTLSGSITAGASSSTSRQWAYGETARPTTLTAAGDLTLTAGRDMHLEGTQAVAGQDLILDVGRDLLVGCEITSSPPSRSDCRRDPKYINRQWGWIARLFIVRR